MKNSKKILLFAVIVTLFTLLFALGASAEDVATSGSCGTNATWSFDSATGTLTISGTGKMENYSSVSNQPWYPHADSITKIVVQKGVTTLGTMAFQNLTKVTEVSLPEGLLTIGQQSLKNTSITQLTIPESVTTINYQGIGSCTKLTTLVIPKNLTKFGNQSLSGCTSLSAVIFLADNDTSITFGTGMFSSNSKVNLYSSGNASVKALADQNANWTSYDSLTFEGYCDSANKVHWAFNAKTGELVLSTSEKDQSTPNYSANAQPWDSHVKAILSVSIDSKITTLGNRIFSGMTSLESIAIPDTVTSLGQYAFSSCTTLKDVTLGVGITSIGQYTFSGCSALESIVLPNSLEALGNYVFNLCKNLKSITLNEGLLTISNRAFNGCTALKTITIPSTVTSLGTKSNDKSSYLSPFEGCTALTDVTFLSTDTFTMYAKSTDGLANSDFLPSSVTIHYYAGSSAEGFQSLGNNMVQMELTNVRSEGTWEGFTWKLLRDGTMTISGDGKMTDFKSTVDARHAPWYGLRKLIKELTFSEGFEAISAYSFAGASNLQSVSFPSTLTYIGKYAFSTCSSLDNLTIGANVELNDSCFQKCTSLKTLVFEEGRTSLTARVFAGCTALEEVVIPSTVTTFGYNKTSPFNGCTGLKTIIFLNKNVTIFPKSDIFAANTETATPKNATIKAPAGGTVEAYAKENGYTFVALGGDRVTVFEFAATFTPAESSEMSALVAFNGTAGLLYVDTASGKLYVKDAEDSAVYHELLDDNGNALVLGSEATNVAIVYDNNAKTVRYYVGGVLPTFGENNTLAHSLVVTGIDTVNTIVPGNGVVLTDAYPINASGTADYIGLQVKDGDSTTIRILAGIDTLYYGSVGFEVSLYADGILQNTVSTNGKTVFSGIQADGNAVSASSYGYRYMTAMVISGIYRNDYAATSVYFLVKPFTELGGVRSYGEAKQITITYDAVNMHHEYN